MTKMMISDYVLHFLEKKKIKKVFLITGGAISFQVDAFSRNKKINYVSVGHEQAAAMMADSYSRIGPNFSCTMVTSGPGATNLLTGIACSYFDSIPSLHICGQVNTYEQQDSHFTTKKVRQIGFQETDIVSMSKPITKFTYKIKSADEIKYILEKSYYLATSGRPGPVLIDIPMDIQRKIIDTKKIKSYIKPKIQSTINKKHFLQTIKYLKQSKRPVLILGGGIKYSKSQTKLKKFLKNFKIPITTTWSGVDLIDHNDNRYIGNIGVYGARGANFTVQNSDCILCLGTRLDTRITGGVPKNFARGAKKIVVDIDKHEINKKRGLIIDVKINEDLNDFFDQFYKYNKETFENNNWLQKCKSWKKKYPIIKKDYFKQKKFTNPYVFFDFLSNNLNKKDIIVADDGGHLTWCIQSFKVKEGQKLFSAFGNSPMGYALPASIGASIANKNSRVICIDGDGSIQINLQELHTINKLKLPVKIFVLNNNGYGIIKQFQELYLEKRYEASGIGVSNPDFKKISKAFNIGYTLINNNKNLHKIKKNLTNNKPHFFEIKLKTDQKIVPKLQFGNPLEDMSPLLPREEFLSNMIEKPVSRDKKIFEAN
ncbi:thiamine pyrophosphate-binding protein [Candidatus Pelagibacter sp.]|nr:thiamine pyrophosphate-binding protein [Candidatus Pelagibacter sp.]